MLISLPAGFPNHCDPQLKKEHKFRNIIQKTDPVGAFLLLAAILLLVAALQEGDSRYPWNSAVIISFFIVAILLAILFVAWQWFADTRISGVEPTIPSRLTQNKLFMISIWLVALSSSCSNHQTV
jgi:protein-S-isoprenylcysteine O-methyltransferase Ste14